MANYKKSFIYRNSLSIVFIAFFLCSLAAQAFFGWKQHNQELAEELAARIPFLSYLASGHFISATFENFQSEFLQMFLYVGLTVFLRQVGSAESKNPDKEEAVDRQPQPTANAPGPVRKGGWRLQLYKHSLSIAFGILFLISWAMHLYGSYDDFNNENIIKNQPMLNLGEYLKEPLFWFETFQNWQSEFLSVASIVLFTIFLREIGSPESKPVDAPHMETGK